MSEAEGRLVGLHHVQLAMPEGEEAAAVHFYQDVLGLDRVEKPPQLAPRGGVWFRSGDLEVHLGVEEDAFRPAVKAHPAFLVQDLAAVRDRLEKAGYKVVDTVQLDGFERFYARDPFGNRLEMIEPA